MVEATVKYESGDKEFGSSSPIENGVFNPDMVICVQNQTSSLMNERPKNDNQASCSMKERTESDDEEYRLFGMPSTHSSDDDGDEFDNDNGMCFKPLFNVDALNFFVNNELNNTAKIKDYFEDSIFSNTALRDECLLIAVYVHHFYFKQPNNFSRKMKQKDWLGNVTREKLVNVKSGIDEYFDDNDNGRGHWTEIEMMRKFVCEELSSVTERTLNEACQLMLSMCHSNCLSDVKDYLTYVLRYLNEKGGKSKIKKLLFFCGDNGIFFNHRPCVLLLRDDHFCNVWNYGSLFKEIDCPTISKKKRNKGSGERYKTFLFKVYGFIF